MHSMPLGEIGWWQVLLPLCLYWIPINFLLPVGYIVSDCDLRCIIALVGIAAYLAIFPIT
jgi:hypothetical protein